MTYYSRGSEQYVFGREELQEAINSSLAKLDAKKKVPAVPPDFTRYHSQSGLLTKFIYQYYKEALTNILPSLGTHSPISDKALLIMFEGVPRDLFRVHKWRDDIVTLGEVPSEYIKEVSEGKLNYTWPVQVNKLLVEGNFDLILSIGQVVPHEVVGMANYNKNIFVGTGGPDDGKSRYSSKRSFKLCF